MRGRRRPRPRTRGLTDRGRAVLAGGLLLGGAGTLLGFVDLTRIGLACAVLAVIAAVVARRRLPRWEVARELVPTPLVAGQPGQIRVTVRNIGSSRSDTFAAAEHVSPWLGPSARLILPELAPGQQTTASYVVRPDRRGRHEAGPLVVLGRDPLGLSHSRTTIGAPLEIVVFPAVHELGGSDSRAFGVGHQGEAPSHMAIGSEHDVSVRPFREGDELRRVHWAVTAHRGELMVRNEAQPQLRRAVLVLDPRPRSWGVPDQPDASPRPSGDDPGTGAWEVLRDPDVPAYEWAVEALASMASFLAGEGFSLHLLTGEQGRAEPGQALSLQQVLARLALVTPTMDAGTTAGPLYATAREVAGGGGLILLAVGDGDREELRDAFGILRTGSAGLALVADTRAFARAAADPHAPVPTFPSDTTTRVAAYARAGGWRAAEVVPGMTPAHAWTALTSGRRGAR